MGFKFAYFCDLLSQLESARVAQATSSAKRIDPDVSVVTRWFDRHQKQIHGGRTDRLAFLSCLFPERRPDRVYGLREASLVKVIGRCLLLGASRKQQLDRWRERDGGDLGQCVENVMQQAENHVHGLLEVTVEEVDRALDRIASKSRFSAESVRRKRSAVDVEETLAPIFRRLSARDAKWLTRLILKDFSPVAVPSPLLLRTFHFLLPNLLVFQDSLETALDLLGVEPIKSFPSRPSRDFADYLKRNVVPDLVPKIGVKIGRRAFYKARSLQHCCTMAGKRTMSLERKYDGEYCQIHIDLSKGRNCIQIFSKSGRNSTNDRQPAHEAIKRCLKVGSPDCQFSKVCILEGELLVWSDDESGILPFHKLRKHLSRGGSFLGAENDSQPHSHEHLYVIFFDILLVDDDVCLYKPYTERRRTLSKVVSTIDGLGGLAEQRNVNFSLSNGREELRDTFAMAVAQRWEGIVLKSCDDPYFALVQRTLDNYSGHWIKFKKEYISGLGDTADFALIGARYDVRDAASLQGVKPLLWTSFFVGCLDNSQGAGHSSTSVFRVVDTINRHNMHVQHIQHLNQHGQFYAHDVDSENLPFTVRTQLLHFPKMDVVFGKPFAVEMSGCGFERPPNGRYFTLRFPRMLKIHTDRTFEDATSFDELQRLAESARSVPVDHLSQEAAVWAARLDPNEKSSEYIVDNSETSSTSSTSSTSTQCSQSNASERIFGSGGIEATNYGLRDHSSYCHPAQSDTGKRESVMHNPTEPAKKRKSSFQHSPIIQVLQDPADPTTATNIPPINEISDHCLIGFSNIPISRSQEKHASPGAESLSSCVSHKPNSRSAPPDVENVENSTNRSRTCSLSSTQRNCLSSLSATGNSRPHHRVEQPLINTPHGESAEKKTHWSRFPSDVPFLLSNQISRKKQPGIQQYLFKSNLRCTTSIAEFLYLIDTAPSTSHPSSSPHYRLPPICRHGIVLVNSNNPQEDNVASEIARTGNTLMSFHRRGELSASGKIMFLHWKSLRHRILMRNGSIDDEKKSLEQWKQVGESAFAGCLKWGHDVVLPSKRRRRRLSCGDETASEDDNDSDKSRAGFGVAASWDWRESLSLFPGPWSESD